MADMKTSFFAIFDPASSTFCSQKAYIYITNSLNSIIIFNLLERLNIKAFIIANFVTLKNTKVKFLKKKQFYAIFDQNWALPLHMFVVVFLAVISKSC